MALNRGSHSVAPLPQYLRPPFPPFQNQANYMRLNKIVVKNPILTEIMPRPWPTQSNKSFWDPFPTKNPPKLLFLTANLLVDATIAQISLKVFFIILSIPHNQNQDPQ